MNNKLPRFSMFALFRACLLLLFLSIQSSAVYSQCAIKSQSTEAVACFGGGNGAITLIMENVALPVTYVWNGPTPGQFIGEGDSIVLSPLEAGLYAITITDAANCVVTTEIMVAANPPLDIASITSTDVICFGEANGSASVLVVGGLPPYQYLFSDNSTSATATGLLAGTYSVTVTDAADCTVEQGFFVWETLPVRTWPIVKREDLCDLCNGEVLLSAEDGTPPYTFEFNGTSTTNGSSRDTLTDLCAGTYVYTVTDANGCTASRDFIIEPITSSFQVSYPSEWRGCNSTCAGYIEVRPICGERPYTIDWTDDSLDGSFIVSDLCEGTYFFTVTDAEGSSFAISHDVIALDVLSISAATLQVACNNLCTGAIDITIDGGSPPYSYLWDNGDIVQDPSGLCAGNYGLTVTDNTGCTQEFVATLEQPTLLEVDLEINDVNCTQNGSIIVIASGGTGSYIYEWDNLATSDTLTNLEAGTYSVTVIDENDCTASATATIGTPIEFELSSSAAACDSTGGEATVNLISTVPNPTYGWSNGGTMATESNLAPGWYSVTVTDTDQDCRVHRNVEVPLDTACFVRISGYVYIDDVNRDCAEDSATIAAANILVQLSNGDATFTDQNGYYEFNPLPGNFTVSIVLNGIQYESLCTTPITVNAADFGGNYPDNNFYLNYGIIKNLVLKINKNNARPGFTQPINICVMNRGVVPMDGTLTFVHDATQEFGFSNPVQDDYDLASQTLTWNFTDHPVGQTIIYRVYLQIPVGTALGTSLDMYFKVDPINDDFEPSNNEVNCVMEVTGSYDPNDKQVTPSGEGEEGNIGQQDSILSYQIRFQNTGTDTAFTVVVRDTLDDNLDVNTVVPGPASHEYKLTVLKGNVLEFTFDNILLPDSFVNEPASNGFVFFDIQLKQDLEYGTAVSNTAAIFFDFNEPIITNTVKNTLKMPTGLLGPDLESINLSLLPNPNQGKGMLRYQLDKAEQVRIRLFDAQGKKVAELQNFKSQSAGDYQLPMDLSTQQPGIYFIHLETAEGRNGVIKWVYLK